MATNEFLNVTKKSKEAKLTVINGDDEGEDTTLKPIELYPQTSYRHTPLNGTNLRLACAASGYPTPTTSWTFVPQSAGLTLFTMMFFISVFYLSHLISGVNF